MNATNRKTRSSMDRAREAWGNDLPDWVAELARVSHMTSQNEVANRLGVSPAMVSFILGNKYKGDLETAEQRVRGALMGQHVPCPAQGKIPADACVTWQKKAQKFVSGSPMRAMMYRACHRCPRFMKEEARNHD